MRLFYVLILLLMYGFRGTSQDTVLVGKTTLVASTLVDSLTIPWDLHWAPNGWVWFNERDGNIYRLNPDTKELIHVHALPDVYESWDNGGAHALALHPNFPIEPYVYTHYTVDVFESQLVRWTYNVSGDSLSDSLIMIDRIGGNSSHNGSRIVFDNEGHLYLSMGDAFSSNTAQDVNNKNGKILRTTMLGDVPDDNPFGDSYTWSYGHRNPQGLVIGRDGILYSSEHGDATDDEVNVIYEGFNYGWPLIEGYCDQLSERKICDSLNVIEPLYAWTPTSAPCGLAYFDHESIPEWRHSLLQAILKDKRLVVLPLSEDGLSIKDSEVSNHFVQKYGRLRDVMVAPNGRVFICTSNQETNGQWVTPDSYDKIIELRNPDFEYDNTPTLDWPKSGDKEAIFPNPADDFFWLSLNSTMSWIDVRIGNARGHEYSQTINTSFPGLWQIDVAGLPGGMHYIYFENDELNGVKKFIVLKEQHPSN